MRDARVLLIAEDDPEDRLIIEDALEACGFACAVHFVQDGDELLAYLRRRGCYSSGRNGPMPFLVLLDLKMPRKDGSTALAEIKADPGFRHLPVVVLTTSSSEEDITLSYDRGASSFIVKPVRFESWVELMRGVTTYWFDLVTVRPPMPLGT